MEDNTAEELMQAFRVFDTEGTGKINAELVGLCLQSLGLLHHVVVNVTSSTYS